jgi:glutaredoxin 3
MYSSGLCGYCHAAETLLRQRGVSEIEKIFIDRLPDRRDEMIRLTGRRTVPQIFIHGHHVGGYDDLAALDRRGELLPLLQKE